MCKVEALIELQHGGTIRKPGDEFECAEASVESLIAAGFVAAKKAPAKKKKTRKKKTDSEG